jgi:phosphoglycerol transferase
MKKSTNILNYINFILISFIASYTFYLKKNFVDMSFEQLLFSIFNSKDVSINSIIDGIIYVFILTIIIMILLILFKILYNKIYMKIINTKYVIYLQLKTKKLVFIPFSNYYISLIFLIITILYSMYFLNVFEFIENNNSNSTIYENYYVDPSNVEITFPENKQNLIYIYLESMENTFLSKENGGTLEFSYIPSLERLALDNINFSSNSKVGGPKVLSKSSWTIAAMVSQTAGITFNLPISGNNYTGYDNFLPGVTTLGDILEENGYKNYLMIGSSASFGGRDMYFKTHGNYEILDYNRAIIDNNIDSSYYVWWGYEDKKLFEFSKKYLTEISSNDEPFNFTMLTVDTHFKDGYLDETCSNDVFDDKYANVYYCNSNMVYEFISWIQQQDFYENTTIILSGDHYTMQSIETQLDKSQRTTYNVFINSRVDPINSKNRDFNTLDMFPTTLASLGVNIKGNKLGLGTNLFSNEKTLTEKLGYEYINDETSKKSLYYNNHFLKEDYYEMLK